MPGYEPRSRSVNREWRSDREWMTAFQPAEREYAMLLGLHADDAGYLQWDLESLLADLYRWVDVSVRLATAQRINTHLIETGRLVVLECGRHAVLPKLRARTGKPTHNNRDEHRTQCAAKSELSPTEEGLSVSVALLSVASQDARAQEQTTDRGGLTDMKAAMLAAGFDPDALPKPDPLAAALIARQRAHDPSGRSGA